MPRNKLDSLIQDIIPPLLVVLLTIVVIDLFYGFGAYVFLIDIFDIFVVIIFGIDLYFRWKDDPRLWPFLKNYYIDIIATIPFNLIFVGMDYAVFTRSLRGLRGAARMARVARMARLLRFVARAPRFLRLRKHVGKTELRDKQPHEKEMGGVLSFKVILLVTINSIMGTGIWFLTAAGAKHAGPASLVSWGVLTVIAIYISMCFSELTAMFPRAGGVYEFAKQTYGRLMSFIIGWTTSIAGSVTIAMLMLGALQYLIPIEYSGWYIPVAIALIIIFNFIAYGGMQTSTYMLVGFALVTLVTIVSIIVPGFFQLDMGNFEPFFVFPTFNLILAIFFIAETFFGWESAIFLSAETKNPQEVMPKALIIGTVIIGLFAMLLSFTAMGVIPWQEYGESVAPLRDLGAAYFGNIGAIAFTILVAASIIGAVASWIVTAPRLLMALGEDKLFFVQFARIHPKHKSPYVSIVFQTVVLSILVIIGSGSYETLLHLLVPLILVLYSAVLMAVTILRIKRPDYPRPYKAPFGKIGPVLTVLFMGFLLYMFTAETHHSYEILKISGSLLAFGMPAYFFIELFYSEKYVIKRKNLMASLSRIYHVSPLPKISIKKMLSLVGTPTKKTTIINYDGRRGGFFHYLINKNIDFKKMVIVDNSKEELQMFREEIPKAYKKKIDVVYRKSETVPDIKADIFVSRSTFDQLNNIPKFLKSLSSSLKKKGTFCFYTKHSLINMSKNALLVDDKKQLDKIFAKAGLDVKVTKKKSLFKTRIYIYGSKK